MRGNDHTLKFGVKGRSTDERCDNPLISIHVAKLHSHQQKFLSSQITEGFANYLREKVTPEGGEGEEEEEGGGGGGQDEGHVPDMNAESVVSIFA